MCNAGNERDAWVKRMLSPRPATCKDKTEASCVRENEKAPGPVGDGEEEERNLPEPDWLADFVGQAVAGEGGP